MWIFLPLDGARELFVDTKHLEQLLLLYERWQHMCEFLIDEYDRLPHRFTEKWSIDNLLEVAGCVGAAKATMFSDFAERNETMLTPGHFPILKEMIDWTRFAALGESRYETFLSDMKDVMRTLRQHPRFFSSRGNSD